MKPPLRIFIWQTIITSILICVAGFVLFLTVLKDLYHPLMPVILISAIGINFISFFLLQGSGTQNNVMASVAKSFILKFFSYILLAIILLLIEKDKDQRIFLVLSEFLLYIVFTWLEVQAFLRNERKK
jgi:hypothetical protein